MPPLKTAEFVAEAREHLSEACHQLLQMERPVVDGLSERIAAVLRAVHSMKGGAGFFGLRKLEQLFHKMETALENLLEFSAPPGSESIDVFLEALDRAAAFMENVEHGEQIDVTDVLERLDGLGQALASHPLEPASFAPHSPGESGDSAIAIEPTFPAEDMPIPPPHSQGDLTRWDLTFDLTQCQELGVSPLEVVDRVQALGEMKSGCIDQPDCDLTVAMPTGPVTWTVRLATPWGPDMLRQRLQLPVRIEPMSRREETSAIPSAETAGQLSATPTATNRPTLDRSQSLRIPLALADRLVNLAGELVLVRNQARRFAVEKQALPDSVLQRFDNVASDFQSTVLETRMQPVGTLFQRFPRLVRDLGRQLGKQIELQIEGSEVEIDKSILDSLADPLTHLVRNACDHGLETSAERAAAQKSVVGQIRLSARHMGDQICIEIEDDGRGINRNAVARKALAQGLRTSEELARLDDRDLLALILLPGFSTAQGVTDLSGRGVGLDVVRTNVLQLGGAVEIRSVPGQGTTFSLRLPLTLAIIPSLLVELSGQRFAIPQRDLDRLVRIHPGDSAVRIEWTRDQERLRLHGKLLPLLRWQRVMSNADRHSAPQPASSETTSTANSVVVIKAGTRRFGLVVDRVLNSEEIVVKPMHSRLRWLEMYSGATILGDGGVALILSAEGLARVGQLRFTTDAEGFGEEVRSDLECPVELLMVRLLGGRLAAIPMRMVQQVVLVPREACQVMLGRWYTPHQGQTVCIGTLTLDGVEPDLEAAAPMLFILISRSHARLGCAVQEVIGTQSVRDVEIQPLSASPEAMGMVLLPEGITPVVDLSALLAAFELGTNFPHRELPRHVLVVDDTEFFRTIVSKCLRDAGFDVTTAEDGAEALELLQGSSVDLVVSDLEMPVVDGLQLATRIRRVERFQSLPLLALSTLVGPEHKQRALEHGFDAYEVKFDPTTFLTTVMRLLQETEVKSRAPGVESD